MFKIITLIPLLILISCQLPAEKKKAKQESSTLADTGTTQIQSHDTNLAIQEPSAPLIVPAVEKVPEPKGIYQVILPGGIEHMVAFGNDHTYQLQERHLKDSVVVLTGNWSPSDGFIWLYKEQVVRARYRWKGKQLEYYSPVLKKGFPMNPMPDIAANRVWQERKKDGLQFFGIGNEPFWSVEISKADSVSFRLADWQEPLRLHLTTVKQTSDSMLYISGDSLRITILPHLCSDGMSDNAYRHAVTIQFKKERYQGCGMRY